MLSATRIFSSAKLGTKSWAPAIIACLILITPITHAHAQEVTLRLHQFLPSSANVPKNILRPWAERIETASSGRIKIQHFDSMILGGRPPELMDQARDGVVDIAMTLVGYTPGRFPRTEVFELPFMMTNAIATSRAFWEMVDTDFQHNEYADVKVLGAWVHGPGVMHSSAPIRRLEDMQGKIFRGPTRVVTDILDEVGATPIGMPLPSIAESLSKGVIDSTVIPWEVTTAIRLSELVDHHTEFSGARAFYTATLVLVMNKAKYAALPPDLRAIIDAESGAKLSSFAGKIMWEGDKPARDIALKAGNKIIQLDETETARWTKATRPVIARWIKDMGRRGLDGQDLIDRAQNLIAKHS